MDDTDDLMRMINIPDPTTIEKLKMVFIPDLIEFFLFVTALLIGFTLDKLFHVTYFSPASLIFIGIACTTFYGYRWGVSSLNEYLMRQENILKGINPDKPFSVNIKLPGVIIGLACLIFGLLKFKA